MADEVGGVESGITPECQEALDEFWPKVTEQIRNMSINDFKTQDLPLARIKKIMKLDEDVKMISAEAPLLFAKAAELFIHELTLRAWVHTEDNKRRTLQRNDIAMAITKFDQFDFLIDIVPRDEIKQPAPRAADGRSTGALPDQYYFQLAQQHQAALQQQQTVAAPQQQQQQQPQPQPQSIQIINGGQVQTIQIIPTSSATGTPATVETPSSQSSGGVQTVQLQLNSQGQLVQQQQQPSQQQQQPTAAPAGQQGSVQIIQQVMGADGQIQQIPIQLNASQLQMVRMPSQGSGGQQTIVLQQPTQGQQVYLSQQDSS